MSFLPKKPEGSGSLIGLKELKSFQIHLCHDLLLFQHGKCLLDVRGTDWIMEDGSQTQRRYLGFAFSFYQLVIDLVASSV